jgi:hypothetical protein
MEFLFLFIAFACPDDLIRASFLEQQQLMEDVAQWWERHVLLFPYQAAATTDQL